MKRILVLILFLLIAFSVRADNYNVHSPDSVNSTDYNNSEIFEDSFERILFILDFSNSMSEYLEGRQKVDLMLETMRSILPNIDKNTSIGLRVYGHKMGLTAMDACRASTLINPVSPANSINIINSLDKVKPRGMTPITYSLKQAVKYDFMGFTGKKHIILLTDGGENCDESPCTYAMELIKIRKDIKIDVIAFNIDDEDDLQQLECASLVTSGKFYSAKTASELVNSLNKSLNMKKEVQGKIILQN